MVPGFVRTHVEVVDLVLGDPDNYGVILLSRVNGFDPMKLGKTSTVRYLNETRN